LSEVYKDFESPVGHDSWVVAWYSHFWGV